MNEDATPQDLIESGLNSLDEAIRTVMVCLQEVLVSSGKSELASAVPWAGEGTSAVPKDSRGTAQLYSIVFQLLDMVEERVAMQTRRQREEAFGATAEKGLWANRLAVLKEDGFSDEEIADVMQTVRVEPVFTAHPTEAKRPSVRERHREIYQLLLKLENPRYTPLERDLIRGRLLSALEALWLTGEIHVERPTIKRELRNALFYLREMFPDVIGRLDRHLEATWEQAGFRPETLRNAGGGPRTRFGLWIGGDRDGHPLVTAEVTHNTLTELRRQAIRLQRRELRKAAFHLTVSSPPAPVPPRLEERIAELAEALGAPAQRILKRNSGEPWRGFAYLLREVLRQNEFITVAQLTEDLELMAESLAEVSAERLASSVVRPLLRKLETFGLHLAELDVRQNSAFHDQAAEQILTAAGVEDGGSFSTWPEERRLAFLETELESPRPLLHPLRSLGSEAEAVLSCYRVLAKHREDFGGGLGSLIVSMTRKLSDLLLVHLFAKEAGLVDYIDNRPTCVLPVVPLFETLGDLDRGAEIVDAYLQHPAVQRCLDRQSTAGRKTQQIMLGYSDSNKDGGILASQVALYGAQQSIVKAAENHGVGVRFFHGRGGTISRGAGPTEWFVRAMPHGALAGDFRMTEQGETIARKYAYLASATYNLEVLQASVTYATAMNLRSQRDEDPGIDLMPRLAESSRKAYRRLLEEEGFIGFYRQATPIDALEQSQIGSRPSRRSGQATLDDLRAIPWVFSWTQARFYLPGWFGVGSALEELSAADAESYDRLMRGIGSSTFARYVLTGVETNVASANLELMRAYGNLVDDGAVRARFMEVIETELDVTRKHLEALFRKPLSQRRPRFAKTLELREAPLRTLHLQQVELLREWRGGGGALPDDLRLSINAIASGLRTTG